MILHREVAAIQAEVVRSIHQGAGAWFVFYLRLENGTYEERLSTAAKGLHDAAAQLRAIAGDLVELSESGTDLGRQMTLHYWRIVLDWAQALEVMSRSASDDHRKTALEGLRMLITATEAAERVVDRSRRLIRPRYLRIALSSLRHMRPGVKVSRRAVRRAKAPWRRTLIAAGSPLRWHTDDSGHEPTGIG